MREFPVCQLNPPAHKVDARLVFDFLGDSCVFLDVFVFWTVLFSGMVVTGNKSLSGCFLRGL